MMATVNTCLSPTFGLSGCRFIEQLPCDGFAHAGIARARSSGAGLATRTHFVHNREEN
jgi:hypothetical protein